MVQIKIKDLSKDKKISKEEMMKVIGGFNPQPEPPGKLINDSPPLLWTQRPHPRHPGTLRRF